MGALVSQRTFLEGLKVVMEILCGSHEHQAREMRILGGYDENS